MRRLIAFVTIVHGLTGVASAADPPPIAPGTSPDPAVARPGPPDAPRDTSLAGPAPPASTLAIPPRAFQIALTVEIESSADKLGKPVTVAPDVTYGATDRLSLSVVHSKFATTGFRAVTGGGVCLGSDTACAHRYNNVGAEALYAVRTGSVAVAAIAGLHALDLDQGFYDVKLGARVRAVHGKFAAASSPSVLLAISERTDAMGATRNKDLYYLPVLGTYKVAPGLTVGLGSGVKGALENAARSWEIPLGAVAAYAVDRRITVGASFVFGKLIGGAEDPPAPAPPATGADYRGTQLWVVVTP